MERPMSAYLTRAISLHRRPTGEREVMLTLFTYERGRIPVIVRGTHKTASTLRAATEPLSEGLYYIVRRRGFDLLSEWEPRNDFLPMRFTPESLAHALYFVQFPLRFLPPAQPEHAAYYLLRNTLLTLCVCKDYHIVRIIYEIGFLDIAGQAVDYLSCAGCGKPADEGRWSFNVEAGGPHCGACAESGNLRFKLPFSRQAARLGRNAGRVAAMFASGTFAEDGRGDSLKSAVEAVARGIDMAALRQLRAALSRFIEYQFNEAAEKWLVEI